MSDDDKGERPVIRGSRAYIAPIGTPTFDAAKWRDIGSIVDPFKDVEELRSIRLPSNHDFGTAIDLPALPNMRVWSQQFAEAAKRANAAAAKMVEAWAKAAEAAGRHHVKSPTLRAVPDQPETPRERALRLRQERNTGPDRTPFRRRGR